MHWQQEIVQPVDATIAAKPNCDLVERILASELDSGRRRQTRVGDAQQQTPVAARGGLDRRESVFGNAHRGGGRSRGAERSGDREAGGRPTGNHRTFDRHFADQWLHGRRVDQTRTRRTGAHLRQNHSGRQRRVSVGHASGTRAAVDCGPGRDGGAELPEARRVAACRRHGQRDDRGPAAFPEWPVAQSGRRRQQPRRLPGLPRPMCCSAG